jgi:hypothetical protein
MTLALCGIDCESCDSFDSCGGCYKIEGKPFYIKDFGMEVCPLYDCPVSKKGYKSCAECSELPCQLFRDWKDPSVSDEVHLNSINERVRILKDSLS